MNVAFCSARYVVLQSTPRRRERGINVLLLTVLGIIATLVFLGVGIAPMLDTLDSTKTAKAKEIMATDIATQVHNYFMNAGQFPGFTEADVLAAMPSYFAATPCDPADSSCTTTSSTSDYRIYTAVLSSGTTDYLIMDTVSHPSYTLNGMLKYAAIGSPPSAVCANNCSHVEYDGIYGIEGAP